MPAAPSQPVLFRLAAAIALMCAVVPLGSLAQDAESRSPDADQWKPPQPPAASERVDERHQMVRRQIAEPHDGREPVSDPRVIEAMRTVPRHVFVPPQVRRLAYTDSPLPIGHDQTISQPYIVARMTELLDLSPDDRVLEIGTGSGYQAAVLAHLTPHVYTIEIVEPLARRADRTLADQNYDAIRRRAGDGYAGWPEAAPFDAVIVTAAPPELPRALWEQLRPGGRIVIPLGPRYGMQRLTLITKTPDGERESRVISLVRFVPMTGGEKDE